MAHASFAFADLFRSNLPAPSSPVPSSPKYNFGTGHNDPAVVPVEALAEAAAATIRRHGPALAVYQMGGSPLGYQGLRDFLAEKLQRLRGMACGPDDILVTGGSLIGMDLVNDLLLESGDTVIIEEFTYAAAISRARKLGVECVPAPLDHEGIRIGALETILTDLKARGVRPKYIYTIPTVQNPTGSVLSLERRQALIDLSRRFGVPIYEDECYADVNWAGETPPSLQALAPEQVIHIGSLSKSLAPALRLGYVVAPPDVLGRMLALKTDGGTGALDQMVAAEYFSTRFDAHAGHLSSVLKHKMEVMVEAVAREFGTSVEAWVPAGGVFLWLQFPEEIDTACFAEAAAAAGVAYNPGAGWSVNPEGGRHFIRLCFALPTEGEIRTGIAELARVCFEQTGMPAISGNVAR